MDSKQNISEYDETTQAAIRKIMFEQKQKVLFMQTLFSSACVFVRNLDIDEIIFYIFAYDILYDIFRCWARLPPPPQRRRLWTK